VDLCRRFGGTRCPTLHDDRIWFKLIWYKSQNKPTSLNSNRTRKPIIWATSNMKNWTIIPGSIVGNLAKIIFELGTAWIYNYSIIIITANSIQWNGLCDTTHPLSCLIKFDIGIQNMAFTWIRNAMQWVWIMLEMGTGGSSHICKTSCKIKPVSKHRY
jgi:hypothetical protein